MLSGTMKSLPTVCFADPTIAEFALRASPQSSSAIATEERDRLLAACAAGEYVELLIDYVAFEQSSGKQNRNFVRFSDEALQAMADGGKGSVFLSDHNQYATASRGGIIVASSLEKKGKRYELRQTAKLTNPIFVEAALRGLIDRFSIGWRPTAVVDCSICKADYTKCEHWPGSSYEGKLCEAIYTGAILIETSSVNVPAVPAAQIEGIRSSLDDHGRNIMNKSIAQLLGIAETASDDEVTIAVDKMQNMHAALAAATNRVIELTAKAATAEAALAVAETDRLIDSAVLEGKLAPGSEFETTLRELAAKDLAMAKRFMLAAPRVTPIGLPVASTLARLPDTDDKTEIITALATAKGMSFDSYLNVLDGLKIDSLDKLKAHAAVALGTNTGER